MAKAPPFTKKPAKGKPAQGKPPMKGPGPQPFPPPKKGK